MESVELVLERKPESLAPVVIVGFPDVGLVGSIAVHHMVEVLGMEEVGYMKMDMVPPMVLVRGRQVRSPITLFEKEGVLAIVSEVPIPPDYIYPLTERIFEFFKDNKPSMVVVPGGLPSPNRIEIDTPGVFGAVSSKDLEAVMDDNQVEFLEGGILAGPLALMLLEGKERGIPVIALMAEAHPGYPDPGAAVAVLEKISRIIGRDIDIKTLKDKEEEIRVVTRDLMKKTEEMMQEGVQMPDKNPHIMFG